jgi:hypothetical protein
MFLTLRSPMSVNATSLPSPVVYRRDALWAFERAFFVRVH